MRQAILTGSDPDGWTVSVPEIGEAALEDPSLADFEARRLIERHTGESWREIDDLDVQLVDAEGKRVYAFDLLFTSYPGDDPAADPRYQALAADPPAGCRLEQFGSNPALRCLRRGTSRFDAIGSLIAEIEQRYDLHADDLNFEKLWEWWGSRDRRERMIAHLLLMAAERARWTSVPAEELVTFVRTVMGPSTA